MAFGLSLPFVILSLEAFRLYVHKRKLALLDKNTFFNFFFLALWPIYNFLQALPTFEIPTFTVTINPLESDEMTFVPGSPPAVSGENQPLLSGGQNNSTSGNNQTGNSNKFSAGNGNSMMSNRSIANMTVIVDDEVTTTNPTAQLLLLNNGQVHLSVRKEMICSNFF